MFWYNENLENIEAETKYNTREREKVMTYLLVDQYYLVYFDIDCDLALGTISAKS